jgi:histidinol dehydrogenase
MQTIKYPDRSAWESLCRRPHIIKSDLEAVVGDIIEGVKNDKDEALFYYSLKFDGVKLSGLKVSEDEISEAESLVPDDLKKAISVAFANIEKFHRSQLSGEKVTETSKGVRCWRKSMPIERVGLYIPGGSAPLFSTVLMLGIPAMIAGCSRIVLCTPPEITGKVNPAILYTASLTGIKEIFKTGGAQAIAAMAYGTESVPQVYKIFGPGNQYVTKAKELVQQDGIPIDMPAGPSEVLVIADKNANPEFVASDLLSQAEHGTDSQVVLVTDSDSLPAKVTAALNLQLRELPRKEIAAKALDNSMIIILKTPDDCIEFSNTYAPEHLIINTDKNSELAGKVTNAGSVFLGPYSCESAGDYASGTNHTLPTNRFAVNYSGISVESFQKKITFQEISSDGILRLGPVIETMAEAENLRAHKNAVSIRLKTLKND